jgi:hypothetical protein
MADHNKETLIPAALWLANILSVAGLSIAGWVLVTVSDLNAEMSVIQMQVMSNMDAGFNHHNNTDLHMPTDKKFDLFVSRSEYAATQSARVIELADLKLEIRRGNDMLSEMLERLARMEGSKK